VIGAIIQARLGSERLPRKVLMELPPGSGVTVLERVVEKVKKAKMIEMVVVTTPDKELFDFCTSKNISSHHWEDPRDPLAEFYSTLWYIHPIWFDPIVRITADCPLLDSKEIDRVVTTYEESTYDYVCNRNDEQNGPIGDGLDVEVFSNIALCKAYMTAKAIHDREHVTPWMRKNVRCLKLPMPEEIESKSLDTMEDYEEICRIWDKQNKQ